MKKLLVIGIPVIFLLFFVPLISSGNIQLYDADNPTITAPSPFTVVTETSIFKNETTGEYFGWLRMSGGGEDYTIKYMNSSDGESWSFFNLTPQLYNAFPYVVQNGSCFYLFKNIGTGNHPTVLYNVTDHLNPIAMNGGNPVLAPSQAWEGGQIFNTAVEIVDGVWHMVYEANPGSYATGYTYSNLTELNWTIHTNSTPIMAAGYGSNPYLVYVPERNAFLDLQCTNNGSAHLREIAYTASLNDDLYDPASWHYSDEFEIVNSSVHIADAHAMWNFNATYPCMIQYCYAQSLIYQTYSTLSLTEFYDAVTGFVGPCTTPVISDLTNSTPSSDSVSINWTTNQSADNRVKYSKNSDLSNEEWSSWDNDTSSISIGLTSLDSETPYYYQAWSYNGTNSSCSITEPVSSPYKNFTTQNQSEGEWIDESGWLYRKIINITGQSGAGTHYQVNFSIGDSSGGDFHLEGHCTDFPNDTVVTDDDGTTKLPFWIEDPTADPIQMWVNVSDNLNTSQDIYVYYGKLGESSVSNGTNTFLFFDDFEDGDVSDWTIQTGTGTIAGDSVVKYAGSYSGKYTHDDSIGEEGVEKTVSLTTCVLECNARPAANDVSVYPSTLWEGLQSGKGTYVFFGGAGQIQYYDTDFHNIQAYTGGTWHKIKLVIKSLAAYDIYIDDMDTPAVSDVAVRGGTPTSYGKVWIGGYNANSIINVDNIFIRKYNANEPAFSSAGSEESAYTTPPNPTNLQNTTGNFWVNYTWDAGSGNVTNSYNVSWNSTWYNTTTNTYMNDSVGAGGSATIIVYAWNSSGSGILSTGNITDTVYAPAADTTFTVSLPIGYTKPVFQPPNSTATNYPPNGQTSSQEFYNISNSGNVNLDIRMRLNTTVSTITFKADDDNTPAGAQTIGTSLVTLHTGLAQGDTADIWLWSDFDHTPPQTANRTVYINVSES